MASRAIVKAIQNPNNEFILKATLKSVTLAHLSFDVLKHYEKKRPSGMVLDASGAFTVANLLDVWGRALGLTEAGVMTAAKKHMFKDSSGTALTPHGPISHLRVAICIANVLAQCWHNASL